MTNDHTRDHPCLRIISPRNNPPLVTCPFIWLPMKQMKTQDGVVAGATPRTMACTAGSGAGRRRSDQMARARATAYILGTYNTASGRAISKQLYVQVAGYLADIRTGEMKNQRPMHPPAVGAVFRSSSWIDKMPRPASSRNHYRKPKVCRTHGKAFVARFSRKRTTKAAR